MASVPPGAAGRAPSRLVGVSLDVMGTLFHVRGFSVGTEYQRVVRTTYFDAPDPKPGCLLERMYELDARDIDGPFKESFKDVAKRWPELARDDRHLVQAMGRRPAVTGGASPEESYAFWKHVVHGVYSRAFANAAARRRGRGAAAEIPLQSAGSVSTDAEFSAVFDTIFNSFCRAEHYEMFPEAEAVLMALRRSKQRDRTEAGHPSSFVPAGPSSMRGADGPSSGADEALNPYAWHGDKVTQQRKKKKEEASRILSVADGTPRLDRLGVVTNFDGRMHQVLEYLMLSTFFDHVFTTHEAPRKPSPAGILRAWGRMDPAVQAAVEATGRAPEHPPSDWLHIGDAAPDAEAAAAAGAKVLLIDPKKGVTVAEVSKAMADLGITLELPKAKSFDEFNAAVDADETVQAHLADMRAGKRGLGAGSIYSERGESRGPEKADIPPGVPAPPSWMQ